MLFQKDLSLDLYEMTLNRASIRIKGTFYEAKTNREKEKKMTLKELLAKNERIRKEREEKEKEAAKLLKKKKKEEKKAAEEKTEEKPEEAQAEAVEEIPQEKQGQKKGKKPTNREYMVIPEEKPE